MRMLTSRSILLLLLLIRPEHDLVARVFLSNIHGQRLLQANTQTSDLWTHFIELNPRQLFTSTIERDDQPFLRGQLELVQCDVDYALRVNGDTSGAVSACELVEYA